MSDVNVKKAVHVLVGALTTDEGYLISWKANIAMAFLDQYERDFPEHAKSHRGAMHKTANKAAENFLDVLCRK